MKLFTFIILMLSFITMNAQTPFTIQSSHGNSINASRSVASIANPWVGGQVVYNIKGNVEQTFTLSGLAMYVPYSGDKYSIPFMTNIGLNNPDSTAKQSGVTFGTYPYYSLVFDSKFQLLVHGGLAYHFKDNSPGDENEFRTLVGLELALYNNDGTPFTLSIAPEFYFGTGEIGKQNNGLSITAVIPIANGLGAVFDGTVPFGDSIYKGFNIGIIANGQIK